MSTSTTISSITIVESSAYTGEPVSVTAVSMTDASNGPIVVTKINDSLLRRENKEYSSPLNPEGWNPSAAWWSKESINGNNVSFIYKPADCATITVTGSSDAPRDGITTARVIIKCKSDQVSRELLLTFGDLTESRNPTIAQHELNSFEINNGFVSVPHSQQINGSNFSVSNRDIEEINRETYLSKLNTASGITTVVPEFQGVAISKTYQTFYLGAYLR